MVQLVWVISHHIRALDEIHYFIQLFWNIWLSSSYEVDIMSKLCINKLNLQSVVFIVILMEIHSNADNVHLKKMFHWFKDFFLILLILDKVIVNVLQQEDINSLVLVTARNFAPFLKIRHFIRLKNILARLPTLLFVHVCLLIQICERDIVEVHKFITLHKQKVFFFHCPLVNEVSQGIRKFFWTKVLLDCYFIVWVYLEFAPIFSKKN